MESLEVVQPLNFEDRMQMNRFHFRIQVIDSAGFKDSWVIVKLWNININVPRFKKLNRETNVKEDVPVSKLLDTFKAFDLCKTCKSRIIYSINCATNHNRQFIIA